MGNGYLGTRYYSPSLIACLLILNGIYSRLNRYPDTLSAGVIEAQQQEDARGTSRLSD